MWRPFEFTGKVSLRLAQHRETSLMESGRLSIHVLPMVFFAVGKISLDVPAWQAMIDDLYSTLRDAATITIDADADVEMGGLQLVAADIDGAVSENCPLSCFCWSLLGDRETSIKNKLRTLRCGRPNCCSRSRQA